MPMVSNIAQCLAQVDLEVVAMKAAQVEAIKVPFVNTQRKIIFTIASRPGKSPERPSPHVVTGNYRRHFVGSINAPRFVRWRLDQGSFEKELTPEEWAAAKADYNEMLLQKREHARPARRSQLDHLVTLIGHGYRGPGGWRKIFGKLTRAERQYVGRGVETIRRALDGKRRTSTSRTMGDDAQQRLVEATRAFDGISDVSQIKSLFIANSAPHATAMEYGGKLPDGKFFQGFHVLLVQGRGVAEAEFQKSADKFRTQTVTP